jgi:hypothetical protein
MAGLKMAPTGRKDRDSTLQKAIITLTPSHPCSMTWEHYDCKLKPCNTMINLTSNNATNQRHSSSPNAGSNTSPTQQPVPEFQQGGGNRRFPPKIGQIHYIRQFHKPQKTTNQKLSEDP